MGDLIREIVFMARHPRKWWHDVRHTKCPVCGDELHTKCPVCGDELPARFGPYSQWQKHKAKHGTEVWRNAIRSVDDR